MIDIPKSRKEAIASSSSKYLAKKPCIHGHAPIRYTSNGICVECRKCIGKKYIDNMSQDKKERKLELARISDAKRRTCNKRSNYMAEYLKNYQYENKAEVNRRYYENNKNSVLSRSKFFRRENKEYYASKCAERRFRKEMATPAWSESDKILKVYSMAKKYGLEVDHIVPLKSDIVCGLHCWHNLQLLDRKHNAEKLNKTWPDMP